MDHAVSFLTERVERLAYESGMHYKDSVALREELEASKKECQELRDALEEAIQGIRAREAEKMANQAGKTAIDASLLREAMDEVGVPLSGARTWDRLAFLLNYYRDSIQAKRTTQDG